MSSNCGADRINIDVTMVNATFTKWLSLFLFCLICLAAALNAKEIDETTGLTIAEGWETVRNNCLACHSAKLITQNHGSRNTWAAMIIWMQETQGLWEIDAKTHDTILTYLSTHYGPKEHARRALLDKRLMPKNPYTKILQPQVAKPEKK